MAKKKRKINVKNLFILISLILVLIGGSAYLYYTQATRPVSSVSEELGFTVRTGESSKTVLKNLEERGIIRDATMASIYLRLNNLTEIKAGNYTLDTSWTLNEIFTTLNDPTAALPDDVRITFREGEWLKEMAHKLESSTNVSSEELMSLWNDDQYVRSLMSDYPFITEEIFNEDVRYLLEGYLFPSTYDFYRETTAEAITKKFLDQTLKIYTKYQDQMSNSSYSIHEIFTLSSIVQYESGTEEDMKLIAGVFYNRLESGIKLESSVTVCYALDLDFEESTDWIKCERNPNHESPYNTYRYQGLPPGPILNPGEAAINAVLNPTKSDYYFFMADVYGDGKVYYAKTYAEHEKNVNKYLK